MLVGSERQEHLAKTNLKNLMSVWEKSHYISSWDEDKCWNWLGNKNGNGYGQFKKFGKVIRLHKFSYEFFKGIVPLGLEIDHLCRNRACFNPKHLESVTHKENMSRATYSRVGHGNNWQKKKTHCPYGHEYILENLVKSAKWRTCRICKNINQQKRDEERHS